MAKSGQGVWTNSYWKLASGCTEVSPGCWNCHARGTVENWGKNFGIVTLNHTGEWNKVYRLGDGTKEHRVQVSPHSDVFHRGFDPYRPRMWDIIREMRVLRPWIKFMILTKRPHNIANNLPPDWGTGWENVWLGVSAENQEWADRRIPVLSSVYAAGYFVSVSPHLGPVDLSTHLLANRKIREVMSGCETGANRRPTEAAWRESLIRQCEDAGVCHIDIRHEDGSGKVVDGEHYDCHVTHQKGRTSSKGRLPLRKMALKVLNGRGGS